MARLRPAVIVHYHEISLKRGNRPLFLRQLARNLERAASDLGPVRLRQLTGRILLDLDDNEHPEAVRDRAARVCGVASVALAWRVVSTLDRPAPRSSTPRPTARTSGSISSRPRTASMRSRRSRRASASSATRTWRARGRLVP